MSHPKTTLSRYGGWLPSSRAIHDSFVKQHIKEAKKRLAQADTSAARWIPASGAVPLSYLTGGVRPSRGILDYPEPRLLLNHIPSVTAFEIAIKSDPEMHDLFNQIFLEVSPENQIPDFDHLLTMLDSILVAPPKFHIAKDEDGNVIGEPIGVPVYLLFDLLSNTSAAYDLFRRPKFNVALGALLNNWGAYLMTADSNKTLTDKDEGWFSATAIASLESNDRGDFNTTYVCPDPSAVNRGYTSWDHFFTREIQPDARPIHAPEDNSLIHSACESTVYRIARDVKEHDQFWLKGQAYSLYNMLARNTEYSKQLAGGTVYQAFLSPQDYHRWHAPFDGTIVKAVVVPGTYYAVLPDDGAPADDPDLKPGDPHGALIRSQAFLTLSSARALIYIKAKNPQIGLMCFIGVGMAEVSTCEIRVTEGQEVKTGDLLGMFHFGGSSHAMIFGPQAKITFADHVQLDTHLKVNSIIAQVTAA